MRIEGLHWKEVLDVDVVDALRELGGEEDPSLFRELVGLFSADAPPRIEALLLGARGGDLRAVESAAHALKSASANLGAIDFSGLCRDLESLARDGQVDALALLARRVPEEYRRLQEALRQV